MKTYAWVLVIVLCVLLAVVGLVKLALRFPDLTYERPFVPDWNAPRVPIDETELIKVQWWHGY
jgi:hypothetical protein